ncbi:hypothetical protein BC939DRAFT_135205 [Gamsiella multidivaricata]|uniref:uncharacterized protein n=1 Tax=Gamsiella multidivaricata TaxID=101098 RepID=UPI002220A4C2|nr:uncharacterized protein BC939DRAFT_135205 [Gamsiella multidivaricata]KAI7824806.1 hypothetical protein BC939DRAFT_135205 [Gamsiella multidivaricata]
MSLSSTTSSSVPDLFRRQSSSASFSGSISTPLYTPSKSSDPMQGIHPRQIGLGSFLLWLREHPASTKVGSENLVRFLLVKSVSLMAASLGCVYGLVFDKQVSISACSLLLFFLPAVQGATGATRLCGLILSLALAFVFLSFQTRSMSLLGPSLETTLLFGLPLMTGMLVGRRVGLVTCVAVLCYSIEEYRSKVKSTTLSGEEAARLWAGFGAYWIALVFLSAMTCLYQWCVEVCVRDANLFKDIAVANAKSKDGVVSSVSHELRTPLAALIGWTELLMSDHTLSSSAQSTVSMLHSSTLSLLTILNALLDVSKVSAAKMTNCSQNFNLHDLVLDTARMMTGLSGTRTVELLVDFSAQVPELVRADPGIIKQVLGNLISNAIKFTDVGYVNVGVSLKEEDDDTVTVEFVVQDTGKGIADEQKDKLFVEFSQVEGGTCKTHEAGTGLGLFLVKNLVEVMNGSVFVTSQLGVGSTFGFVIKMEKQFLAFRTPGYDHVVTVSSAFQAGMVQEMDPSSPVLPVTPGLARSTTPSATNESMTGIKMTPVLTPATPKDPNQAKDYFTLQPSEVTRANANNITLRTRDHAFLSNRQYYLHSQCGYFEDFLWNTAAGRWKAQAVRRLSYEECIRGWHTDLSADDSMARFGDVFLIDLSPATNRSKSETLLTDQEHARLFLVKMSKLLITRAKARIGKARQASIILFYPFGHPPSVAQEPLLTLGQYYQISLCRKPVSERALGVIIKKQVVTVQAKVSEGESCPSTTNASSTSVSCTSNVRSPDRQEAKRASTLPSVGSKNVPTGSSAVSSSSSTSLASSASSASSASASPKLGSVSQQSTSDMESGSSKVASAPQASHVRFAKKNGSVPKITLDGNDSPILSSSIESLSKASDRLPKGLLKRRSINIKSMARPALISNDSIQSLNASGKRVLIVDDNSFNRNLLFHQLRKLGVSKVDQAGSGQEAVDMFLPGIHALVLMDLKMPIMGGFQATTLIREKELAYWGPSAVHHENKGSPLLQTLNESWLDDNCPWSPERFAGPPDMADMTKRRESGSTSSSRKQSSDSKTEVAQPASIVAVTADWTAEIGEDREKALSGGFDDVMVKPISLPSLSILLERYMEVTD